MELKGVTLGSLHTRNALIANGLMASPSFSAAYRIVARLDLTVDSEGVTKAGATDTSEVYQIKAREYATLFATASYNTNQTDTPVIATPGEGKRVVITYLAFRSSANTGSAFLEAGSMVIGTTYFEAQKDLSAPNVHVECPENEPVNITTTTGSSPMTVAILYQIEEA